MEQKYTYSIFDPEWITSKDIDKKIVIFLDTFVWSNMVRNPEDPQFDKRYINLKNLLLELSQKALVHLAVYPGLLFEIAIRDDNRQYIEILSLIETLTRGVYFKDKDKVFSAEYTQQLVTKFTNLPIQHLDLNDLWGPFWEFSSFGLNLDIPDWLESEPTPKKDVFFKALQKKLYGMKISDDSSYHLIYRQVGVAFKQNVSENLKQRFLKNIPQMMLKKLIHEERISLARFYILKMAKVWLALKKQGVLSMENLVRYKAFLREAAYVCPTFDCYVSLQARLRADKDKYATLTSHDAYDVLHIATSLPYADIVFCDNPIVHICNEMKLGQKYNTKLFSQKKIDEFINFLNELNN